MIHMQYTVDDLKTLPLRAIVALAVRCARRVERLASLPDGHPDAASVKAAADEALRVAETFARGEPCPSAEQAVEAIEAVHDAASGEIIRENAYASIVRAIHAAATAARAVAEEHEPGERLLMGGHGNPRLASVAGISADLAAMGAFTAALNAAEAVGSTDEFTRWAAEDFRKLQKLKLGEYPEAGDPIDPSPAGPLGPLWPKPDFGL